MAENQDYGGFWIRLLALLVDTAILTIGSAALLVAAMFALGDAGGLIGGAAIFLAWLLYFPLLHASARQATVGKAMLGLKVTDYAGNRISILRSFGRYLATFVSSAVFMLGYLVAAFTRRKQALHDLLA